jgi:hypothetical protein
MRWPVGSSRRAGSSSTNCSPAFCTGETDDAYWNWYKRNRSAETVAHRKPILQSFGKSVPGTLRISALRGFHVQKWLDKEYPHD